jgi:hypothetical protein
MVRHLVCCLTIAVLMTVSVRSAEAADETAYDTVDQMEFISTQFTLTGIIQGQSAPSVTSYFVFGGTDALEKVSQCQRIVMLVMSKPGKFRLTMLSVSGNFAGCRLTVRTP